MFGWRKEEVQGQPVPIIPPEADVWPMSQASGPDGIEAVRIHRDGTRIPVRIWVAPISDGTGYLSVIADLRAAKRAEIEHATLASREREARESAVAAHRSSLLFEAAPDAILEVDDGGRIVLANSEAERMFQRSKKELLGLTIEALVPERFRDRHFGLRTHYAAHPVRRPMGVGIDLYALRKDGTEFAVDIKLSPVAGRVMCVVRDVSERRRAEEEIKVLNRNLERRSLGVGLRQRIAVHAKSGGGARQPAEE